MCFRSEVHHRVDRVLLEDLTHLLWIRDVTPNETVSWIFGDFFQVAKISCIREQVQVEDLNIPPGAKNVSYETGTDETGSAGNEKLHCCLKIEAELWIAACGISSAFASD